MEHHPYFNLRLHSDDELRQILNRDLRSRQTIHEWPLSCVQSLTTTSGDRFIYKSQFGPTVEAQFYNQVVSPLLPGAQTLYQAEDYVILLIEFIEGSLLDDLKYSPSEVVQLGRSLVDAISHIGGEAPYYYDIGTAALWHEFVQQTLDAAEALINCGKFSTVKQREIEALWEWAMSKSVMVAFQERVSIVHGDATGENILLTPAGLKIIDWQRPIKAPSEIDLVALLESQQIDSREFVAPAIRGIFYFTRLAWAVECQKKWIPQADYDAWVKGYIRDILQPI